MLKKLFVLKLVRLAEEAVLAHLKKCDGETLGKVLMFKEVVEEELRICGTIFNALALVKNLEDGHNHPHQDREDLRSMIIMSGKGISGGALSIATMRAWRCIGRPSSTENFK